MGQGIYKNGVAIETTYQAVNNATGKTITMNVYDELHALDEAKSSAGMTEIAATGRYYASFTPDAEGIWTVIMLNTSDSNGPVVKQYAVGGNDIDSIGDTVVAIDTLTKAAGAGDLAAMKTVLDTESGVKAAVTGLNNFNPATDNVAVVSALTGHTAQTGDNFAIVNGSAGLVAIDTVVDGIQTDLSNATDGLGAIKDAVDAVGTPAMVG